MMLLKLEWLALTGEIVSHIRYVLCTVLRMFLIQISGQQAMMKCVIFTSCTTVMQTAWNILVATVESRIIQIFLSIFQVALIHPWFTRPTPSHHQIQPSALYLALQLCVAL